MNKLQTRLLAAATMLGLFLALSVVPALAHPQDTSSTSTDQSTTTTKKKKKSKKDAAAADQ